MNLKIHRTSLETLFMPANGLISGGIASALMTLAYFFLWPTNPRPSIIYYDLPIVLPFAAFGFARAQTYLHAPSWPKPLIGLDFLVVGFALARAVFGLPYVSGHALFLVYALITTRTGWVRIPAGLILAEVIYLKAFVWQDPTLYGGALAGVLTSWIYTTLCASRRYFRV